MLTQRRPLVGEGCDYRILECLVLFDVLIEYAVVVQLFRLRPFLLLSEEKRERVFQVSVFHS